jgi:hypothetical protein
VSEHKKASDFADLAAQVVALAESLDKPYSRLLRTLSGCYARRRMDRCTERSTPARPISG